MKQSSPKIAVFYDWLNHAYGGAEKVLIDILKIYPSAHVYALVYDPLKTPWLPPHTKVFASAINRLPFATNNPIYYTPLYTLALQHFDLSQYDIIISTTSTIGHQLKTKPHQLFICYFHNINRYLYQIPPTVIKPILKIYQHLDTKLSKNPHHLLCNSQTVQRRIQQHYHRQAKIVYPGIDTSKFHPAKHPSGQYFLVVSRLVPHKNIHLTIQACESLKLPLKIVGTGRLLRYLQKLSHQPTTEFLGSVNEPQLIKLYQNCLALIHPQVEDFGLTVLEAQSCGKPVVALRSGGATETIIDHQTGLFFDHPTVESLTLAIKNFPSANFHPTACRRQAVRFSQNNFMLNFKNIIDALWQARTS